MAGIGPVALVPAAGTRSRGRRQAILATSGFDRDPATLHVALEVDRDTADDPLPQRHLDRRLFRGIRPTALITDRYAPIGAFRLK